jgi:WS/DGAT/MGAT family acyltransferase
MWRADVDPMMRSTVLALELLDREPQWDRLVAAHDWASRRVPRLRDRVVEPLGVLGTPVWVNDRDFDLHYHVRRVRLAGDGGWSELLAVAEQLAMTPCDRARPPWEAVLVGGLPDGKAAYLLKLHHALSDGMGLAELLSQLHSRQRAHTRTKPQPLPAKSTGKRTGDYMYRQIRNDLGAIPSVVRETGATLWRGARDPAAFVSDTRRYLGSARRVLSPPSAQGLPLLAARGASWRFAAVDVPFADLRAAAKTAGGTLNDAFLAALLGAFRLYHEEMGVPLSPDSVMPVSVPISVRREHDRGGGNRIAPARLAGPVGEADPSARIATIRRMMLAARSEPALESAEYVAPFLARLPSSAIVRIAGMTTAGNDLQASNVPGVREEMYLAGARIERIYPFAPLPGCAAMITLHTYREICSIGANLDAAAITDPGLFGRCLLNGFAEVLSLRPGAATPRLLA